MSRVKIVWCVYYICYYSRYSTNSRANCDNNNEKTNNQLTGGAWTFFSLRPEHSCFSRNILMKIIRRRWFDRGLCVCFFLLLIVKAGTELLNVHRVAPIGDDRTPFQIGDLVRVHTASKVHRLRIDVTRGSAYYVIFLLET